MPSLLIVLLLWLGIAWNSLADWQLEGPVEKPRYGVFWSMSHGGNWPPAPCVPLLFSDAPVYKITGEGIPDDYFLYDDTEDPLHSGNSLMSMLLEEESDPESDNPPVPPPGPDAFGTNLWLVISNFTGSTIPLAILNTTNGLPYEVLSATNVLTPLSNWISEGIWVGQATNTPAWAELGDRTNQLFFIAHQWDGTWRYGVPTNGQLFMQIQSSPIHPIIDGTTNTLYASFANWLILNPSNQHVLNLGYDANDGGITNSWLTTNAQQGVIQFYGVSRTITNLCLSYNPLTNLSVSRWPALQSVDAWHCTNMLAVYVTNAPELRRVCFEAFQGDSSLGITNTLDFSGCPKIAEIRAADNRFRNVAITNGAGPEVWHLCIHDNTVNQLPPHFDFAQLPSLRELWVWNNQFTGPLTLTTANSTNLQSVEVFGNSFTSQDFTGQTNLDHIWTDGNSGMTNMTITGCAKLRQVEAYFCNLSSSAVDHVLITLNSLGLHSGITNGLEVQLQGNAIPSPDGVRAAKDLKLKGWNPVFHALPPSGTPEISAVASAQIGSNYATITWVTDIPSDSSVYYTTGTTYALTNVSSSVTNHSVTVSGLSPASTYKFYVHSTSGAYVGTSADYQFTTRGGPGIYFVNNSSTISMEASVTGTPTVTWLWGDGTSSSGPTATHSFYSNSTSAVVVDPASALLGFGVACQMAANTTLSSVSGLTNYPNLRGLYLYQTDVSSLSLAGCTNLTYVALVGCNNVSTSTANAWFNDLTNAQSGISQIGSTFSRCGDPTNSFFCPAGKVDSGGSTARTILSGKGWNLYFY